MMADKT